MKRRILLVDDEVAVLLTLKAILEISGFQVDTAASGREGKHKVHTEQYHMVITDMRMENDEAGREVIEAARSASYRPAVAVLSAYPLADEDWQEMGADRMLVKPMHTRMLLQQLESLLTSHERKLAADRRKKLSISANGAGGRAKKLAAKKAPVKASVKTKKAAAKKAPAKKAAATAAKKPAKKAAKSSAKKR